MSKEARTETVDSVKLKALKSAHWYHLAITAIVFMILGTIMGYFTSITVISEAQSKVVNSIQLTASVKE